MSELGVAKEIEGMRFLIEKIETQTGFECTADCFYRKKDSTSTDCNIRKTFQLIENEDSFKAIVVTIVATNFDAKRVGNVDNRDVIMVDSDGFSHKGTLKCFQSNLPQSEWGDIYTEFLPKTKVRYKVLFPTLADGLSVSKVIIRPMGSSRNTITFNIEEYGDAINEEFQPLTQDNVQMDKSSIIQPYQTYNSSNYYTEIILQKFRALKVSIHSRLNNRLTEKEHVNLENKISTDSYALELELESRKEPQFNAIKKELDELLSRYKTELVSLSEAKKNRVDLDTRVEELYSLSPREFEEYTQQLLIHMGYENVVLTPYVNDKGIDLFCERNGEKIAVQCKKYKGTVGSPEIISFIGAMSNAHVDSGIFITTGMFTFEAETLAAKNPILLINRVRLAKIVIDLLDPAKSFSMDEPKTGQITIDYS